MSFGVFAACELRRSLLAAARRCSPLLAAARRCSPLLAAARRFASLRTASHVAKTTPVYGRRAPAAAPIKAGERTFFCSSRFFIFILSPSPAHISSARPLVCWQQHQTNAFFALKLDERRRRALFFFCCKPPLLTEEVRSARPPKNTTERSG